MNISNQSMDIAIATLLTSIIIKKYKLESSFYGMIYGLFIASVNIITNNYIDVFDKLKISVGNYSKYTYTFYVICGIVLLYYICVFIHQYIENNKISIVLYDINEITKFQNYMKLFPEIIKTPHGMTGGNIDLIINNMSLEKRYEESLECRSIKKLHVPTTYKKIYFDDSNLKIKGYILWKSMSRELDVIVDKNTTKIQTSYYYPTITIERNYGDIITNGINYVATIDKIYVNTSQKKKRIIYFKKIFFDDKTKDNGDYTVKIDKSTLKKTIDEYEKEHINSFFSPNKMQIWERVKILQTEPEFFAKYSQVPRASYILYGPPGTGKSSFITKLAISLGRHIVNIDLREYKKRSDIYNAFKRQNINGYWKYQNEIIFLLDEFDLVIEELEKKENYKREKFKYRIQNSWNISDIFGMTEKQKDINKDDVKKDDVKKDDAKKDDVKKDEDTYYDDNQEFTIKDLVELFQGSIPSNGLIMFAITNDFEKIYEKCPKLFRDGRMTPIKFDNLDLITLQELSIHYFEQPLDVYFEGVINHPTSKIIELALDCKIATKNTKDSGFKMFESEMQKLLS